MPVTLHSSQSISARSGRDKRCLGGERRGPGGRLEHDRLGGHAPFLWTPAGGMIDLGTLSYNGTSHGTTSKATAVNDLGEVVGQSNLFPFASSIQPDAFLWTKTGGMIDLKASSPGDSIATAVNKSGQVVGDYSGHSGSKLDAPRPFSWTQAGGMVDLGGITRGCSYYDSVCPGDAHAVNAGGQVVGEASTPSASDRPFLWTPQTGMVFLGDVECGSGAAVNDLGHVVGSYESACRGPRQAFFWMQPSGIVELASLSGADSTAVALNERDEVVGSAATASGEMHATLWRPVNTPGPPTTVAAVAGNGEATVSFTAPGSDGGAPINSYTVMASPAVPPRAERPARSQSQD
jgi:probable HAF family extracellular repeat protein